MIGNRSVSSQGRPIEAGRDRPESSFAAFVAATVERRRFRQRRGIFVSEKMGGPLNWTNAGQCDALTLLEFVHEVAAVETWPEPILLDMGLSGHAYPASLGLTYGNGRKAILDLVRSEDACTANGKALHALLAEKLAGEGILFMQHDPSGLRHDPRFPNALAALRSVRAPVDEADEFSFLRMLRKHGTPIKLKELDARGGRLADTACVLAMRRSLLIDLSAPSPGECAVSLPTVAP